MKKIKKILTIGLAFLLMLCMSLSFVGCKVLDKKTKWYHKDALSACSLENLPKPNFQYKGHDSTARMIRGNIMESDFQQYAQQLLDYMYEKFEYLGTSGSWLDNPNTWNPECQFISCGQNLEDYRSEIKDEDGTTNAIRYLFLYFIDEPSLESTPYYSTSWNVEITYYLSEQTYREKDDGQYKDKYTYNFSAKLRKYGAATNYVYTDITFEKRYQNQYSTQSKVSILHYYEEEIFDQAFVLIYADNIESNETVWTETIGDYVFHYPSGTRILGLWGFYSNFQTLSECYEEWRMEDEKLANLEAQHRALYPELYDDKE